MAQFYGKESEYLKKNKLISKAAVLIYGSIFFFTLWFILTNVSINLFNPILLIPILILFTPLLIIVKKLLNKEKKSLFSFVKGKKGEDEVSKLLEKLSDDYVVFRDLKIPGRNFDIDFVVLHLNGIYALEVKSHKGKISYEDGNLLIDGKEFEKDILKQTKGEAFALHEYLKEKLEKDMFVTPVLVFSNKYASMRFGLKRVEEVYVINKAYIKNFFNTQTVNKNSLPRQIILQELKKLI